MQSLASQRTNIIFEAIIADIALKLLDERLNLFSLSDDPLVRVNVTRCLSSNLFYMQLFLRFRLTDVTFKHCTVCCKRAPFDRICFFVTLIDKRSVWLNGLEEAVREVSLLDVRFSLNGRRREQSVMCGIVDWRLLITQINLNIVFYWGDCALLREKVLFLLLGD